VLPFVAFGDGHGEFLNLGVIDILESRKEWDNRRNRSIGFAISDGDSGQSDPFGQSMRFSVESERAGRE